MKSKGKTRQLQDEPPWKLVIALIELVAHRSVHVRAVATHASQRVFYEQIHHKRETACTFLLRPYICSIFCFHWLSTWFKNDTAFTFHCHFPTSPAPISHSLSLKSLTAPATYPCPSSVEIVKVSHQQLLLCWKHQSISAPPLLTARARLTPAPWATSSRRSSRRIPGFNVNIKQIIIMIILIIIIMIIIIIITIRYDIMELQSAALVSVPPFSIA